MGQKKKYAGPKIDFIELGAWIVNNRICHEFLHLWEGSDAAHATYLLNRTSANWQVHTQKLIAARKWP